MKKNIMLLMFMLCLMMAAVPAMAAVQFVNCTPKESFDISVEAESVLYTKKDGTGTYPQVNQASDIERPYGKYRVVFNAAGFKGLNEDLKPATSPTKEYDLNNLVDDIFKEMREEISKHFEDGEIVRYMYLDAEGEAYVQHIQGDRWVELGVPTHKRDEIWATSVTGTVDYRYFGGRTKKVKAIYSECETTKSGGLSVQVKDVRTNMTDSGVQMTFDHLSPVMIAWTLEPVAAPLEAPDMPSTGDSSSLPGLFILLGLSIAAMGAMKLRRREN